MPGGVFSFCSCFCSASWCDKPLTEITKWWVQCKVNMFLEYKIMKHGEACVDNAL